MSSQFEILPNSAALRVNPCNDKEGVVLLINLLKVKSVSMYNSKAVFQFGELFDRETVYFCDGTTRDTLVRTLERKDGQ
jgi:hypothetical protein